MIDKRECVRSCFSCAATSFRLAVGLAQRCARFQKPQMTEGWKITRDRKRRATARKRGSLNVQDTVLEELSSVTLLI